MATAGAFLVAIGLALGILPFLIIAFVLFGSLILARASTDPGLVIERDIPIRQMRAREPVRVQWTVAWSRGDAVLTLHDALPEAAEVTRGSNLRLASLDPGPGEAAVEYEVAFRSRGPNLLPPTEVAVIDPFGLRAAFAEPVTEPAEVTVEPHAPAVPRLRAPAGYGTSLFPEGDTASRGPRTNDFRELRPYVRGDPLRIVNWKATARASAAGEDMTLIVNEYEVEGKKSVWVFLDASPYTAGGTTAETVFDHLVDAALSVSHYYLDRGHRVGFCLYGQRKPEILFPDAGTQQMRRILGHLTYARPGNPGDPRVTLDEAVLEVRGFLARDKPLIHVFTLLGRDPDHTMAGLANARAIAAAGRRPAPAVIVSPKVPATPAHADRILAALAQAEAAGLRSRGAIVLEWEPGVVPIQALLATGVMGR